MSGIIHRGSPEHKAHLAGVDIEKKLDSKPAAKSPVATGPTLTDGPTVDEFVKSGYDPKNYPPHGYKSLSTPEEIAKAIAEYDLKKTPVVPPRKDAAKTDETKTTETK